VNALVLIPLFFAHWIGDYVFQTSKMATQKSSHIGWLLIHVVVYTSVVGAGALLIFSWREGVRFALVNGGLHLVTDFFTSRLAARFSSTPRIFYPILGFDQFIHISLLVWTMPDVS